MRICEHCRNPFTPRRSSARPRLTWFQLFDRIAIVLGMVGAGVILFAVTR